MLKAKVPDAKSRATSAETRIQEMGRNTFVLRVLTEDLSQTVAEEPSHAASFEDAEIFRFRTVVSSVLLPSKVQETEATDTLLMRFPSPPQVLPLSLHLHMFCRFCLRLRSNLLVFYAVRVTVCLIVY